MNLLRKYLSEPIRLIDIGARAGVHPRWKSLSSRLPIQIIGFEPDAAECVRLNQQSESYVSYLPNAVGRERSNKTLYLLESEPCSSLHKPNYAFIERTQAASVYRIKEELSVAVEPLDEVLSQHRITNVDYMKIDTEGYEVEILHGARHTLSHTFAVELEVWFNPVFEHAPLFSDIDVMMRQLGFTLFDVARSNFLFKRRHGVMLGGPKGQLVAGDALYFRDVAAYPADSLFYHKQKLVKSLVLLMEYCYFDCALELAEQALQYGTLSATEFEDIRLAILTLGKPTLPAFRGRHRVEKFFKRLGRLFSEFESDYLGNWK